MLSRSLFFVPTLLAVCFSFAAPLPAQQDDARVLPRGVVRLHAAGVSAHFPSALNEDPVLDEPLSSATFPALSPLEQELNRFFAATAVAGDSAFLASPENLLLGTLVLNADVDAAAVPIGVEVGILPGFSAGAILRLVRNRVGVERFALSEGTVGVNPDPTTNQARFALLGEEFGPLGALPLLPTAGSALGAELQRRAAALGGESAMLLLPDTAADADAFQSLLQMEGLVPIGATDEPWQTGDLELFARFQFLDPLGGYPYPDSVPGVALRSAIEVAGRVPTSSGIDPLNPLLSPGEGPALGVQVFNDIFFGRRILLSMAGSFTFRVAETLNLRATPQRSIFAPASALQTVERDPGAEYGFQLLPRFRLVDAVTLEGLYSYHHRGEDVYTIGGADGLTLSNALVSGSRNTQAIGGGIRFTSFPEGVGSFPLEFSLRYRRTVSGMEGGMLTFAGSIFYRAWGEREANR